MLDFKDRAPSDVESNASRTSGRGETAERNREPTAPAKARTSDTADSAERTASGVRATMRGHPYAAVTTVVVIIAGIGAGIIWWLHARQFVSTDDAFIDTRIVPISADVTGNIVDVPVTDNQLVKVGAVLVRIDPRDYQAALAQAQAKLDQAQSTVANLDAQISAQEAKVDQAQRQVAQTQAVLQFAQEESQRAKALVNRGAGTVQNEQKTGSDLRESAASYAGAKDAYVAAAKQVAVLKTQKQVAEGQVEDARAAVEQAQTNLTRATIHAPIEGRVTNLSAAKGAYAQPGQALMILVPRHVWVTANFKETELTHIRSGEPVSIEIDAYPDRVFRGHVNSIQAGSGAAFSLLPPENATGNFVKVVQRVPVKIVFDKPPEVLLGPGMSVVPTVKVR